MVKLWLDDTRPAPKGFVHVRTAEEAIACLATGDVTLVSLDHDLEADMTGYDVLIWLERCVVEGAWYGPLPKMLVHSANPAGRRRMELAIKAIEVRHGERKGGGDGETTVLP
ncbi:MAG: hypothetical protein KatS3mg015_2464 [Fimbriimonadales bacterium]|nr:MAG: hypothetical protein KatS3mg015_2464 [Fimbriimonadales bacterium]